MNIGTMRHPITIRALQLSQDPMTGAMTESWADLATVWGRIDSVTGREFMAASAEQATTTHRVTLYYRDDLTPDMRLVSDSIEYRVKAILPNNERSLVSIMCEVLN